MNQLKSPKVLFFVDGMSPSPEDIAAAGALNAQVCFRNARHVPADGALEECDGVAGCVPPRYADKFPTAEQAIEKRAEMLAKMAAGDSPAPAAPKPQSEPKQAAKGDAGQTAAPATAPDAPQGAQGDAQGAAGAGDAADAQAPGGKPAAAAWGPK